MSRSMAPNILIAARVQRLLSPLPLDTQKTILEFTPKCLEEEALKEPLLRTID